MKIILLGQQGHSTEPAGFCKFKSKESPLLDIQFIGCWEPEIVWATELPAVKVFNYFDFFKCMYL